MSSNVPHVPATEEAQGPQEATVDCVTFFLTDWWNDTYLYIIYTKIKNPILRNLYKVVNLFQVVTPQFLVDNGWLQVQLYST